MYYRHITLFLLLGNITRTAERAPLGQKSEREGKILHKQPQYPFQSPIEYALSRHTPFVAACQQLINEYIGGQLRPVAYKDDTLVGTIFKVTFEKRSRYKNIFYILEDGPVNPLNVCKVLAVRKNSKREAAMKENGFYHEYADNNDAHDLIATQLQVSPNTVSFYARTLPLTEIDFTEGLNSVTDVLAALLNVRSVSTVSFENPLYGEATKGSSLFFSSTMTPSCFYRALSQTYGTSVARRQDQRREQRNSHGTITPLDHFIASYEKNASTFKQVASTIFPGFDFLLQQ